jgi:adenylate cyclase
MADIFISYSSQDRAQADQLAELLSSAGLSVWIDRQGIEAATSWSGEIVDAIDECKVVTVLLSPSSVSSKNVTREVALAFEKNKKILPLDLEPTELTRDLQYHLAGIQRAPMTNIDSIIRALQKLGLEPTSHPIAPAIVKPLDNRKSLMILPLEDLSPTGDNSWFTDGMAIELINGLSKVKSLRVIDWNTSRLFKEHKIKTIELARELNVQYFIEGQVRKFGDQIKISVSLLDIQTGDFLWHESMTGMMNDVFEIQDAVSQKALSALQVFVTQAESVRPRTSNAEAYECFLKARDYFRKQTRAGLEHALDLNERATVLDPNYSTAFLNVAACCNMLYRNHTADPSLLERGKKAAEHVRVIEGESANYDWIRGEIYRSEGKLEEAAEMAKLCLGKEPNSRLGLSLLSDTYELLDKDEEALDTYMTAITHHPYELFFYANALGSLMKLNNPARSEAVTRLVRPVLERHLRLNPDDLFIRSKLALLAHAEGNERDALSIASSLLSHPEVDKIVIYNAIDIFVMQDRFELAADALIMMLERKRATISELYQSPLFSHSLEIPEIDEAFRLRLKAKGLGETDQIAM